MRPWARQSERAGLHGISGATVYIDGRASAEQIKDKSADKACFVDPGSFANERVRSQFDRSADPPLSLHAKALEAPLQGRSSRGAAFNFPVHGRAA